MSVQTLEASGKPAFAVLSYAESEALRERADDAAAVLRFAKRHSKGDVETVPIAVVDRLLAGKHPLHVWREYRGMTAAKLAAAVDITPAHVSKLESGRGEPSVSLLRKLEKVLAVQLEELAGGGEPTGAR